MYRYKVVEERRVLAESGAAYTAYGIKACGGGSVLDVSTNKAFVSDLVEKINKNDVEPIHLLDVIEDALC